MLRHLRRRIIAPLAAVTLVTALAACGGEESPGGDSWDGTFRWGSSSKPTSLDPRRSATFDPMFLIPVYDSLIRRNAEGELVPSLATEWNLSEDALQLELTLRDGVTFHDGAPFNAEAVQANIEAGMAPGHNLTSRLSVVDSVDVVDPTHVVLHLTEPSSHILGVLAGEAGMMISPDALDNEDLDNNPVGTGPFTVSTYNQSSLIYDKWDGYWDKDSIQVERIEMTFLLDEEARLRAVASGQVDAAPIRSNQKAEAEASGLEMTAGEAAFLYGVMLNTSRSELDNPLARKALIHAIDREAINQAFFEGDCKPVVQPFPSSHWAHVPGLEDSEHGRYDPELARDLLDQAGLPDGFELEIYMGTAPTFQAVVQAIQAQLGEVGINATLTAMENTALVTARRQGEFESSFASIQSGRPDPSQFVVDFYTPDGVFNPGGALFPGVEDLLAEVRQTADQAGQKEAMDQIITSVLETGPPMIPVCSALVVWAHADNVEGLEIAVNYDYDFRNVYLTD